MKENAYQAELIKELKETFPGCIVLKTESSYIQGFPDLLVLYRDRWAALEVKRSADASKRPNQLFYVDLLDSMSFAAFIDPDIHREVMYDLQLAFEPPRSSRRSRGE